jgi:hypothetical protein
LTNDGDSRAYTGYELDWIRQRQKADVERKKKYAKLKKKVDKLSGRSKAIRP